MVIVSGTEDIKKTLVGQFLNFTISHSKKKKMVLSCWKTI